MYHIKTSMAKSKKPASKTAVKPEAKKTITSGLPISANEVIENWENNKEKYRQSAGIDKSVSHEDAFVICVQKARYGTLK